MRCTIYTDGSFRKTTKGGIYGCGIFALFEGVAEPVRMKWADNNSDWAAMWNIAGELCAVLGFMDFIDKEFPEYNEIDIYYDQNGVEDWVTGKQTANRPQTLLYRDTMRTYMETYKISFHHVNAHKSVSEGGAVGNHEADALAKEAVNEFARERGIVFDA